MTFTRIAGFNAADFYEGKQKMIKYKKIVALVAAVAMPIIAATSVRAAEIDITVQVSGLESTKGNVVVALFDEAGWTSKQRIVAAQAAADTSGVTLHLAAPQPGKYGIKAFHDLDADGEMDKTFIGVPKEPYGFSNNAEAKGGPPDFSAASFDVSADGATQTINLR